MISVQTEDFDISEEYQQLRDRADNAGAVVAFSGLVREMYSSSSDDSPVQSLYLEHYPGMTENCLQDIAEQACGRWDVQAWRIIHRVGELRALQQIVFVGVASAHRQDAFQACEFIMDYLKSKAPFWKKQVNGQGSKWIESRDSDQAALKRWE